MMMSAVLFCSPLSLFGIYRLANVNKGFDVEEEGKLSRPFS